MLDKNATLKQCTEQRLTTKDCMHAEISPQDTQNFCLLNQIKHVFFHFLFAIGKILERMQIIWGRPTYNLMLEDKSNKLKIGAM